MKITIEPSSGNPPYRKVVIDTLSDDERTSEAVEACLRALVASGHHKNNIMDACAQYADTGDIEVGM